MTFQEILEAVNTLSPHDQKKLRDYLNQQEIIYPEGTSEERIRKLDAAVAAIREGLTEEQLKEMTDAMNEEYIEPWDESEWTD